MENNPQELNKIKKEAKKAMPDFDTIINLFDMTFTYISKESAKLSDHTPKEMMDRHIAEFTPYQSSSEEFRDIIVKSVSGCARVPIKKKSGKVIDICMKFVKIDVDGTPYLVTKAGSKATCPS